MVIINQNEMNQLVFTLTELKVTNTNTYLFEFINATSNEAYYCVQVDNSSSPYRYNRFCIRHKFGVVNPEAGEVNMKLTGFYSYAVYENPDAVLSPINLNKVEIGKLLVAGNPEDLVAYESQINPDLVVFNPNDYE